MATATTVKTESWHRKARIIIYRHRADQVFGPLLDAYNRMDPPFGEHVPRLPQKPANLPTTLELGSRAHACFLFFLCLYMRGGNQSDAAAISMGFLYEEHPELFIPEKVQHENPVRLAEMLDAFGLGALRHYNSVFWVENARRLQEHWDGDPVRLLEGITTYEQALERIQRQGKQKGFHGFQEKMVSMFIYFLLDSGFGDHFDFPPPVDIQVLRQVISHRIVHIPNLPPGANLYFPRLLDRVRYFLLKYCQKKNIAPLVLSDIMWIYGRTRCRLHPGNSAKKTEGSEGEIVMQPIEITWAEPQLRSHLRSCGPCPVAETCTFEISSNVYYRSGTLSIKGPRQFPDPARVVPLLKAGGSSLHRHFATHDVATATKRRLMKRLNQKDLLLKKQRNGHESSTTQLSWSFEDETEAPP